MFSRNNSKAIAHSTPLDQISPALAWEAWDPSDSEPWNRNRASLLFRRGGFGASPRQIDEALERTPGDAVATLFETDSKAVADFERDSETIAKAVLASGDSDQLPAWWLHRMIGSPNPLVEKLTLFWHGHFATGAEKVQDAELMYTQNQMLRRHALGDFKVLVHEVSKDPAMLIYLDSITNRKAHPNENYARELMELFCLGEGNYSERDVQELARCFTGWEIRRKQFRFNSYQHDEGKKSILGQEDIESGDVAIDQVVGHSSMPYFIVGKLFRFLICDEPEPSRELLEPLAKQFVESGYSIGSVVRCMLSSRLMLGGWSRGRRVRSPVELVVEMLRTLDATTNLGKLSQGLRPLGQALFFPPNVKGWDGGRAWINSSTLIGRSNLVYDILQDESTRFARQSLDQWCPSIGVRSTDAWLAWLGDSFLAVDLNDADRKSILRRVQEQPESKRWSGVLIELANNPKIHLS